MMWPEIFTALITPFTEDGALNADAAADLARTLAGQGSGGFILAGSTGEAFSLNLTERKRLFTAVRGALEPSVPVWLGCGTNDTRSTIALTEAADSWGADGILLVTPYYNKPTQEGLYRHFTEAARRTSRPVMLYNVPGRTAVRLTVQTVTRIMAEAGNVLAVKEATGTLSALMEMARGLPSDAKLYVGDDSLYLAGLLAGASGVVSVAAHVVGPQMTAMAQHLRSGQLAEAAALHRRLWPVFQELFALSNPIPLKWLLNRLGIPAGPVRLPLLTPADASALEGLWQAYVAQGGLWPRNTIGNAVKNRGQEKTSAPLG